MFDYHSKFFLFTGDEQIEAQIQRHFTLPQDLTGNLSDEGSKNRVKAFDDYLYLSGIQQGRCYETAVNTWRQKRNSANNSIHKSKSKSNGDHNAILSSQCSHTMGILYWQLNDVWQGPSWSSLEYGGKWKPLQYVIKQIFDSVVLSFFTSGDSVDIYVTNDGPGAVRVRGIQLCLLHWVRVKDQDKGEDVQQEKETGFVLFKVDSAIISSGDSIMLKSLLIDDQQLKLAGMYFLILMY
jgi:beta-mannosidase